MKTAKEIMIEASIPFIMEQDKITFEEAKKQLLESWQQEDKVSKMFISIINTVRKETIEESAAICHEHMDSDCFDGEGAEANILNLINELK